MDDIYKNVKEYSQNKNTKYWLFLMIWLLICIVMKKINPKVTELFIGDRKLNISLVFITQCYFVKSKNNRPNSTQYFIMKIPSKWKIQQIRFNHLSDRDFRSYINLYKECNTNACSFLVINTTLSFGNLLRFRKNRLGRIYKIIMSADDKIRDEKLHYYIIREVAKISALTSEKIDKFEYLRGETILPPD